MSLKVTTFSKRTATTPSRDWTTSPAKPDPEQKPEKKSSEYIRKKASLHEPEQAHVVQQGLQHHQAQSHVHRVGARSDGVLGAGIISTISWLTRSAAKKRGIEHDGTENTPATKKTKEGFKNYCEGGGDTKPLKNKN